MIFKRIRDIFTAGVHETLDKMEDPIVLIKQYLRDIEAEIIKAEQTISQQFVMEKRHALLIEETRVQIAKRSRQAQLAVETGDEEIAKVALQDKVLLEAKLGTYEQQYATLKTHNETLNEQLRELQEKYSEMKAKQRFLFARAQAAKTQQQLSLTLNTIDTQSAVRGFARMEERVLNMEAHAEASHHVLATHRKLEQLTQDTTLQDRVEEELAKLKAARTEV